MRPAGPAFIPYAQELLERNADKRVKVAERCGHTNVPALTAGLLPARNVLCPCGSTKKYKKCCRLRQPYVE